MIEIKNKINARQVSFDYAYRFYVENNHSFNRDDVFDLADAFYKYLTKEIELQDTGNILFNEQKIDDETN